MQGIVRSHLGPLTASSGGGPGMGGTGPGPAGIAESKVGFNIDLRTHPRRIIVGAPIRGSDSGSILRSNTVGVTNCEPDSSATTLRSITVGVTNCDPESSTTPPRRCAA